MSYTGLELASMEAVPTAGDLVGTWDVRLNPYPASDAEREGAPATLGFGKRFFDHMAHAVWTPDKGWHGFRIEAYGPSSSDPAGAVLHYGRETFERLKTCRHENGSIWTFRSMYNAARLNHSDRWLAIPEFEYEAFIRSLVNLVYQGATWVPNTPGSSLHLRPFIFASEAFLGIRVAERYENSAVVSLSGAYFTNGSQPIDVWVERELHRVGPGRMGDAKTGGNHASSLLPKTVAHKGGHDEVMFLDVATDTNIDELDDTNVFAVMSDGSIRTPKLTGNILAGCTRSSILQLPHDDGADAREETPASADVLAGIEGGAVAEMFICGTAAVTMSIGSPSGKDFRVETPGNKVTRAIYDRIMGIQLEKVEDHHGWLYRLA